MSFTLIFHISELYNIYTYLVGTIMYEFLRILYKHNNIDIHLEHHADFKIFYFYLNVQICVNF